MKTLALTMIAKNEARCLARCLKSLRPLADEILLADTGSTDETKEIALSFGAKVFDFPWQNDFSAARNFILEQSTCDWNLVIDADEYLKSGRRQDLNALLEGPPAIGKIKRINDYYEGKEISQSSSFISRLLPSSIRYTGKIHEQPQDETLPRKNVPLVFGHDGYLFESKGERNLQILFAELSEHPNDPYYLFQTAHTLRILKRQQEADQYFKRFYQEPPRDQSYCREALLSYLYNTLEREDFETGVRLIEQEKGYLAQDTDFWFFCGIFYMKMVLFDTEKYIRYLPQIEASYLTCLRIGESPSSAGVLGTGSFKAAYNLGVWYEVSGNQKKAAESYEAAAHQGYAPAKARLTSLL